jgi:probable F420-dependent oxidoreductase
MRFFTRVPGLVRYPPNYQAWEADLTPSDLSRIAVATETAEFDGVAIPEQIVLTPEDASVMGRFWPDCLTTVAFLAGATETLHFQSSVLILPLHRPIELAKTVATLDLLTGARFELGVGVSIFPTEYEILGVPYRERGRLADEYLAALLELWGSDHPRFDGAYVQFDDVVVEPKPRDGRTVIWVGGDSDAAIRRAARFGDGWMPWRTPIDALPGRLEALQAARPPDRAGVAMQVSMPLAFLEVGEDHKPVEGSSGRPDLPDDPDDVLARLTEMRNAGVTTASVPTPTVQSLSEYLDWLARFGEDVIARSRGDV